MAVLRLRLVIFGEGEQSDIRIQVAEDQKLFDAAHVEEGVARAEVEPQAVAPDVVHLALQFSLLESRMLLQTVLLLAVLFGAWTLGVLCRKRTGRG